jgi:hypothetical protein
MVRGRRGELLPPVIEAGSVRLSYRGLDNILRSTTLRFDPPPEKVSAGFAQHRLIIPPGGAAQIRLTITAVEGVAVPAWTHGGVVTTPPGGHGRARTMRHPRIALLLGMALVVVPALISAGEGQAPKYGGIFVTAPLSGPPSLSPHEEATIAPSPSRPPASTTSSRSTRSRRARPWTRSSATSPSGGRGRTAGAP